MLRWNGANEIIAKVNELRVIAKSKYLNKELKMIKNGWDIFNVYTSFFLF